MKTFLVSFFLLLVVLAACADKTTNPDASQTPPVVYGATKLLGQWNGPEGTYLLIAGTSGKYALTIKNLDGARTFQATGLGDAITFERDGKLHTVRATDGAATGMKWLSDKKNCVTVEVGEGYCRD
jgi:hypothetical protein